MEHRLTPAFTVALSGDVVSFQGSAGDDLLFITTTFTGYLTHNLPPSGNLVSSLDLDPTQPGEQKRNATELSGIVVHAGQGDDTVDAKFVYGIAVTAQGEEGADRLYGGDSNDVFMGGEGNDILYGFGGADWLDGGEGDDELYGYDGFNSSAEDGADLLIGGIGNDRLRGDKGDDQIYGGDGDDEIQGGQGEDQIEGNADNDRIWGDEASDRLDGGAGNDFLYGDDGNFGGDGDDLLIGGDGMDSLRGDNGNDRAYGGDGDDILEGNGGDDYLEGNAGMDALYGFEDNDTLKGDDGGDWLFGGEGADILDGGDQNDNLDAGPDDGQVDTLYPGKGGNTAVGSSPNGGDILIFDGALTFDNLFFQPTTYTLNGVTTALSNISAVTYHSHGGNDSIQIAQNLSFSVEVTEHQPVITMAGKSGLLVYGSFSDPGDNQTWTASIDYGAGPMPLEINAFPNFGYYLPYQPFADVLISIADNEGNVGTKYVLPSDPPVISGITGAAPIAYKENALPTLIASLASVTEPDSPNFATGALTVEFSSGGSADDRLAIKHTSNAKGKIGVDDVAKTVRFGGVQIGNYTGGAGTTPLTITFNASATAAAVQATLRAITYANLSDNPSGAPREVAFRLTDGDGGTSNTQLRTVNVTAVNDKPLVMVSSASASYSENGSSVIIDSQVLISDHDSADFNLGKLMVKAVAGGQSSDRFGIMPSGPISVSGNSVRYNDIPIGTFAGTTTLTVTLNSAATAERVQDLARQIVFSNLSEAPTTTPRQISFTLSDGDGGTSLAGLGDIVNVAALNDAPALILSNSTPAKYTENAAPVLISSAGTVVDIDLLDFDGGVLTAAITGNAAPTDILAIKHSDPANAKVSVDILQQRIFYTTTALGTYEVASFSGGEGANPLLITFNDRALKTEVQAVMKAITFESTSDTPSTAQRMVSLMLTDGDGGVSSTVLRSVDVIAKNDAPLIGNFGQLVDYGGSPVIISNSATITDMDSNDFLGGKLTVALATNKHSLDRVTIEDGNGITANGGVVSFGGDVIGTYTGTTTLIVTFNSSFATPDAVGALLRQLSFRTTAITASRLVSVTAKITDGDGGTSSTVSKTISIAAA